MIPIQTPVRHMKKHWKNMIRVSFTVRSKASPSNCMKRLTSWGVKISPIRQKAMARIATRFSTVFAIRRPSFFSPVAIYTEKMGIKAVLSAPPTRIVYTKSGIVNAEI